MNEQIPRALNNGFGMVPNLPGNGRYDAYENMMSGLGTIGNAFGSVAGGIAGSLLNFGLGQLSADMNARREWHYQQMYMDKYGSPQAQMKNMTEAGINPFTAAQNLSGAAGQSGVSTGSPSVPDVAGDIAKMADSNVNPDVSDNLKANTQNVEATTDNVKANTKLTEEQTAGQVIENLNKQAIFDATLREMEDAHEINEFQKIMLANDAALSSILFTGKISQFFANLAMDYQELLNAEAEHERILKDIDLKKSEIILNKALKGESESRTALNEVQKMIDEENLRWTKYRNDLRRNWHYDPESSTETNIANMIFFGDLPGATALSNALARLNGFKTAYDSENEWNTIGQQKSTHQAIISMLTAFAGGFGFGAAGKIGSNNNPVKPKHVFKTKDGGYIEYDPNTGKIGNPIGPITNLKPKKPF